MFKRFKKLDFYCFSPPVMIFTFLFEICGIMYLLFRYRLSKVTKLAIAILSCLAIFQLSEFNVCEGAFLFDDIGWAKVGYIAITFLPPLGIHLIATMSEDKSRTLVRLSYATAVAFVMYFLLITSSIHSGICLGNYVILYQKDNMGMVYGAYYYGLLFIAIYYAYVRSLSAKPNVQKALWSLTIGYLLFIIPTTLVNIVNPSTIVGIPSIMCGFAVLLAAVIVFKVIPEYQVGCPQKKALDNKSRALMKKY